MNQRRRSAFTLTQLLILLALLVLFLGFFLASVGKVRFAAARASSANNMKQIGIACHNIYDSQGSFPAGVDANGYSALTYLLPYIEQDAVYKTIDLKKAFDDKANENARKTIIKVYLSPNDPIMNVNEYGATNYVLNAGSEASLKNNNGIFYEMSKVKFPDIKDGTSNTMLSGETLKGDGNKKAVDRRRQHVALKDAALNGIKDDTGVDDWKNNKNIAGTRCASWMDGRFLQTTFTGTRTLNDEKPDVDCGGKGGLSGLRSLSDGTNIGMADGSVRYITNKVGAEVWKLLTNRDDGQALPDF
jgi:prepilin-type processing-associated H-X9-DG protein